MKTKLAGSVKRALQNLAFGKRNLMKLRGFSETFLDGRTAIPLLHLNPTQRLDLPKVAGNKEGILHYSNFSVVYNRRRRVPFYAAYAIDGEARQSVERASGFRVDPRMDRADQLDGRFYNLERKFTEFEIGHMAANNEMGWGEKAQLQSYQTFHFPNSVPQAERLNSGMWQQLEKYVINESRGADGKRICVFTGPVIKDTDPPYVNDPSFQMPLLFFKVILYRREGGLRATGFLMSHKKRLIEEGIILAEPKPKSRSFPAAEPFEDYPYREVFQVNIDLIERESGFTFQLDDFRRVQVPENQNQLKQILETTSTAGMIRGVPMGAADPERIPALNLIL